MALTLVQSKASTQVNGTSQAEVVLAAAPTQGNLLLAIGTHWNNNNMTANAGWTEVVDTPGVTDDGVWVGYKYAGASESTTQTPFGDG